MNDQAVQEMDALQDPVVPHLAAHLIHVPEIVLAQLADVLTNAALHVPEIVHHVPEKFAMQVVADAMTVQVQLAMSPMVAQSAIRADSVLHLWIAIHLASVRESSSLIFQSMSLVKS
jgi:hypothetical protein